MNGHHTEILKLIKAQAGKPAQHTLSDAYLGNPHPQYAITVPTLRKLAKQWMKDHPLPPAEFVKLLDSLIAGKSSTEKCMAGILLDYATPAQRNFTPTRFNQWLNHVVGWVEIDTLCTGKYAAIEVPRQWESWVPLLQKFVRSKSIEKRRASLVLLCAAVRQDSNAKMVTVAFENILQLSGEKDILITKAISWLLRNLIKHHRLAVEEFLDENRAQLPAIAVRETAQKLKTGRKSVKKLLI